MDGWSSSQAGSLWQPSLAGPCYLVRLTTGGDFMRHSSPDPLSQSIIDILRTPIYCHHKSYPRYGMPEPSWRVGPLMGDQSAGVDPDIGL